MKEVEPKKKRHLSESHKRNLSEAKKNQTAETRRKISEANSGPKHYNWQGGLRLDPEYRVWSKNRRSGLRRNCEGSHTFKEWQDLRKRTGSKCLRCGKKEPEVRLTIDHIVPLSKGGTDYITNIQPLCMPCNSSKSDKIQNFMPYSPDWEKLREEVAKEIDFMCDHWVKGDDNAPYQFGGWRGEVIEALAKLFESKLQAREEWFRGEIDKLYVYHIGDNPPVRAFVPEGLISKKDVLALLTPKN